MTSCPSWPPVWYCHGSSPMQDLSSRDHGEWRLWIYDTQRRRHRKSLPGSQDHDTTDICRHRPVPLVRPCHGSLTTTCQSNPSRVPERQVLQAQEVRSSGQRSRNQQGQQQTKDRPIEYAECSFVYHRYGVLRACSDELSKSCAYLVLCMPLLRSCSTKK